MSLNDETHEGRVALSNSAALLSVVLEKEVFNKDTFDRLCSVETQLRQGRTAFEQHNRELQSENIGLKEDNLNLDAQLKRLTRELAEAKKEKGSKDETPGWDV